MTNHKGLGKPSAIEMEQSFGHFPYQATTVWVLARCNLCVAILGGCVQIITILHGAGIRRNVFRRKGHKCGQPRSEGSLGIVHGSLDRNQFELKGSWPGKVFNLSLTFQLVKIERQGGLSKYSVICLFLISCSVLGSLGSASGMKEATQHLATFSLCALLSLFSFLSELSFFCSAVFNR